MKKYSWFLLIICVQVVFSQKPTDTYTTLWTKVYAKELELLPKSALEQVNKIYKKAEKEDDKQQLIKCLLYQSKFAMTLEENSQLKVIQDFKKAINRSTSINNKAILHSYLAQIYWEYYNTNQWKIQRRSKTSKENVGDDFRKWGLDKLIKEVQSHFSRSLKDKAILQKTDRNEYKELIELKKEPLTYKSTLFDVLAYNALDFYKDSRSGLNQPKEPFLIDDIHYVTDLETATIVSKDTTSQKYLALKTYQSLLQFYRHQNNLETYFNVLFQSIDYVIYNATFDDKQAVKIKKLKALKKQYPLTESTALLYFELAKTHFKSAKQYPASKIHQFDYAIALEYCNKILKKTPEAFIVDETKKLKEIILKKKLDVRLEEYIPINKYSKVLLNFRNIEQATFSIVKLDTKQQKELDQKKKEEEQQDLLKLLPKIKEWNVLLPQQKDNQEHTTEVALPKLPQGKYLLIGKAEGEQQVFYKTFWVTDLTFLSKENNTFQVLDRWTGAVVENAKVQLKKTKNYRRDRSLNKTFKTDALGEFIFKNKHYYSGVTVTVTTPKDTAVFDGLYINGLNRRNNNRYHKEVEITPFLFTDRSIYRPGQKVYFKAIVTQKVNDKASPFANKYVELIIENPNGEEVKRFDLKTNEYGTVAGEFTLQQGVLTGRYHFNFDESEKEESDFYEKADFDFRSTRGNYSISVEEYKRPKFETSFNPVKGVFKVNDSVKVTGTATALAGSKITDAKVSYRVVRKARYPRWCWWVPQPISSNQEITHGETSTNANGEYTIPFVAIPDATVDKKQQPTFYYTVFADVTDVNGETRSTETEVKVGYHAMLLSINTPTRIEVSDKDSKIKIDTENLNGQFLGGKGEVKIYKLQAPKTPQRKTPWAKPDSPTITKEAYHKMFPNEVFEHVKTPEKWKKGDLVYSKRFDTNQENTLPLGKIKKWATGNYVVIAEGKDKWGQKVKDEVVIALFNKKEKVVADNKLFEIYVDKRTYQPKDEVVLSVGSASKDMTVFLEVEKNHKIISKHQIRLNDNIKKIKIPVNEADRGGFAIKWHWVNLNSVDSGVQYVNVPHKPIDLNIETLTFRDKLEPGAKQKWSFKITGAQQEKVAAEVLASMYDASLDQFKTNNWSFHPINQRTYSTSSGVYANVSFKTATLRLCRNSYRYYYHKHHTTKDQFKWFGLSITNNKWKNSQYLNSLKKNRTAYDVEIEGVVLNDDKDPLIGVAISIKNTKYRTISDFDGKYKIKIKKGDILVFDYIGYKKEEINTGDSFSEIIFLEEGSSALEEVVVVGYGRVKKREVTGSVAKMSSETMVTESALQGDVRGVQIRGVSSLAKNGKGILYVVDGILVEENPKLKPSEIEEMVVLKEKEAISVYGVRAANGVVVITTKAGLKKQQQALANVKARTNFNETAFFFPQLRTNADGEVSFEFTMPEDLTRWKLQLLAHDQELHTGYKSLTTVTQKQLMVIPNVPRFLREGDVIVLSTKISNLADEFLQGRVKLELTSPVTGKNIDALLQNNKASQSFTIAKKGNTSVSWELQIPENIAAVQYKIVAVSNEFSDGEQNVLPVLSNRMLVTETLPLWVNGGQTKTFTLNGLKNNKSKTSKHHQVSLEITSNPAWYAIQALPYLMEYPHECAEQTFARYYANQLASHVVRSNPKIKEVFQQWANSDALVSNLEKNSELKSIIIQETPWLRDAQSETEQKKRMALLFDFAKMDQNLKSAIKKLDGIQKYNGGFPWFKGGRYASPYITQHIVQGYKHLQQLGVKIENKKLEKIITKAQGFLDDEIAERYQKLLERAEKIKNQAKTKKEGENAARKFLAQKHLYSFELQYLYVLSFDVGRKLDKNTHKAVTYYTNQAVEFWKGETLYNKGLLVLIHHRNKRTVLAQSIVKSLKENSVLSQEMGRYWKENKAGWYWYKDPIVTQSLLIEVFSELEKNTLFVDELKQWLLKNKQVQQWKTTKATSEAVYALLLQGSDWLSVNDALDVEIGGEPIPASKLEEVTVEVGTGYFKTNWKADEVTKDLGTVTLTKKDKGVAWGGLYWQYFEDLDKIKQAKTPLSLKKEVFLKKNTDSGPTLVPITENNTLKVGDLLTVRIELTTDRMMEFIHMKDMRAAGLEPVNVISTYKWQDGLGYYQSTKDTATHFFFDRIKKGVYVFEYDVRVSHKGMFSNGITNIESMYAPEFSSHSKGIKIEVK